MFSTGAISPLSDTSVRTTRQWVANQLYQGYVQRVAADGSIDVMINNRSFRARSHDTVRPGDLLSLRLLGTEPEPHFAVVGILRRAGQDQAEPAVRSSWLEATALLRRLEPGLATLNALWQRYPEQLSRLGWQLPGLLSALQSRALPAGDLLKPDRFRAHVLGSGLFFDVADEGDEARVDLKWLLLRLLHSLQPGKQLCLSDNRLHLRELPNSAAQTLQDKTAELYAREQEAGSGGKTLRQLLALNAEAALMQLVAGQLGSAQRSVDGNTLWIMQLLLDVHGRTIPVDVEVRHESDEDNGRWEVEFCLQLPHSGQIRAAVQVKNPTVMLQLYSDNPALIAMWRESQLGLKRMLEQVGLQLRDFSCYPATSATTSASTVDRESPV